MLELIFEIIPFVVAALAMVVLRAGASQVFFDVVGSFQATRLIADAEAKVTVLQSLMLDGLSGIQESAAAVSEQMTAVIDATVPLSREIAEARLEFEKFANFAGGDEVAGAIERIGLAAGFTADQALNAGARMAQLSAIVGGGAGVAAATQTGIEFGLIGGMGTEDAMKRLISLQQQTNFMYGELTSSQVARLSEDEKANLVRANSVKLMDELNTIENRSAATMSQITYVMNQYASSAQLAGESTQFMAAMSATLIEAGEEQGKAGRALRMMYARLGADTSGAATELAKYGIAVKDSNGQMRSMEAILGDINNSTIIYNDAEKMRIAQAIAGNDHYVRAIKLIDNYERATELSTQAAQRLDTAQEELNRRYEDQAFQLTQVEAALNNANARLGNHFVPGVIFARKEMGLLSNAMADLGEEIGAVGSLMGLGAAINEFGKIFSPLVEANLNMMSLNVSLRTQQALTRAISGEEIVRANAYGQKNNQSAISMAMLDTELGKEDMITKQLIIQMQLREEELTIAQQLAILTSREKGNLDLIQQKHKLAQIELARQLHIRQKAIELEATGNSPARYIGKTGKANLEANEKELAKLKEITQEKRVIKALEEQGLTTEQAKARITTKAGHIHKGVLNSKKVQASLEKQEIADNDRIVKLGKAIERTEINIANQKKHTAILEGNEVKAAKAKLDISKQALGAKGQEILLSLRASSSFTQENNVQKILQQGHTQAAAALNMKTNAQQQNKVVTDAMTQTSKRLSQELGLEESHIMRLLALMPAFRNVIMGVDQANKALVSSSMQSNMSMMKLSGALGGVSMLLSMLSDNEDAAKLSAVLMTASMIPATVQMLTMAGATATLAATTEGANVATKKLTMSQKLLTKANLALLAVTAVIAAAMWASKDNYNEATDAIEDFGMAVSYTAEQYEDAQSRMAGKDAATIASNVSSLNSNILATEKELANSTDDTNKKVLQARLDLYNGEKTILLDIMNLESSRGLLKDEAAAQNMFNLGQELKAAEAASDAAKTDKGYAYVAGVRVDQTKGMLGGKWFRDNVYAMRVGQEDMVADAEANVSAVMQKIPEEYRGAVADIAKNADDFTDFLSDLEKFAEESGQDFGAIFEDAAGAMDNFIGPIEAAKEAIFEFNSEREEMFFGMSKGNLTGDMVKQVVNKGVETLINTTEVIMTNTFNGMTTTAAAREITGQVIAQLNSNGLNIKGGTNVGF